MDSISFFDALEQQYKNKLPFVVYTRPVNSIIKCWLQEDDAIHQSETFRESGFLFAPFNLKQNGILFPKEHCLYSEITTDHLEVEDFDASEITQSDTDRTAHIDLISKGIESIKNNDLQKVVLSRCETKSLQDPNPLHIFKRLFNTYTNAMVYCWYHPKVGLWIGATPELLLKVEGKRLTTISLAGTQPYQSESEPNWTNKEFEEQQIVTDYITEQLKPYTSNINVSEVDTVRAGNLLHLKTRIISVLKEDADLKTIIEALHPTPAVCGFSKAKAKDFILNNENYDREYYTGFLGELNLTQSRTRNTNRRNVENNAYAVVKTQSNFYVNLRCMQLKDAKATIYVGGGITKDSNPVNEWEETVNKTATINAVLN